VFNENLAKIAEQYLKKGSKVYVEGQMATRKWEDQSGQSRYSTEVVLQKFRGELQLLDKADRPSREPDDYGSQTGRSERNPSQSNNSGQPQHRDLDDEIPF
jgi:single-strand DNA-binding protein